MDWGVKHRNKKKMRPGIWVDGNDGGDPLRGGNLAGVDHDEQLHEVVVHLPAPGLHDVHVLASHRLL